MNPKLKLTEENTGDAVNITVLQVETKTITETKTFPIRFNLLVGALINKRPRLLQSLVFLFKTDSKRR